MKLDWGCPVIASYELNGITLHPLLDTGNASRSFVVPSDVFSRLKLESVTKTSMPEYTGVVKQVDWGYLQVPRLGSGVKHLTSVFDYPLNTTPAQPFDSIMPYDMLDADYVIFLLSQNRLRLEPAVPNPAWLNNEMYAVPFLRIQDFIVVAISCEGKHDFICLDTGCARSIFYSEYATHHSGTFVPTGKFDDYERDSTHFPSCNVYRVMRGLSLQGETADFDVPLSGDFDVAARISQAAPSDNKDTRVTTKLLPYERNDAPSIVSAGFLGMDVLSQYDFMLDNADSMLYLWSPDETPQIFPPGGAAPVRRRKR